MRLAIRQRVTDRRRFRPQLLQRVPRGDSLPAPCRPEHEDVVRRLTVLERSKRGRYRIRDPFFRFWFRFVYGTGDRYDDFGEDAFETLIEPELADFVSPAFEDLCGRALRALYPDETITDTGQWWYEDHEVDVVGLTTDGTLIAGECKFQSSPLGYDAFSKLRDHVDELRWTPSNGGERDVQYALFSRSGFRASVEEEASDRDDLRLFFVEDVIDALRG